MRKTTRGWTRVWRWKVRAMGVVIAACVASLLTAWVPAGAYGLRWPSVRHHWPSAHPSFLSTPSNRTKPIEICLIAHHGGVTWTAPSRLNPTALIYEGAFSDYPGGSPFILPPEVEWPSLLEEPSEGQADGTSVTAWGWPWRSMYSTVWLEGRHVAPDFSLDMFVAESGSWSFSINNKEISLPLHISWRGFIGNAAVFGAIISAPWMLTATRRFIRRQRVQCHACGYSLRGSIDVRCPECGASNTP